ncbi:MAG: calcium-binding protein [Antarcticimicrobium sp.]|uniref:calcium-binding protein n=1 Tax=Antarcticimicrobium sp. TaxID=2824147 RepID=UPI002622C2FC|nr:calcium-binding protein [Antarcticimicrobium sp.]MDF1716025.1 calcium-binding protein [Antarcticimicrobium sp.]
MPTTPELWLSEFTVNIGNLAGTQVEPQITQLSNGNILVAWEDDTNNVDNSNGTDIIGQIYDPLGDPVGSPFRMNNDWFADDEGEFEITATPGGGWILAFEDTDGTGTSIRVEVYDSAGTQINTGSFTEGTGESFNDPTVTVNGAGDAVIAWNIDNGSSVTAHYSFYDASAGTFTAATSILASGNSTVSGSIQNLSVAALSNGSFVLVTNRDNSSGNDIIGRLITASGSISGSFFPISTSGTESTQPDVAALSGGGFVAVWQNFDGTDRDAYFRIFDNSGTALTTEQFIQSVGLTNNNNELSVTGLADGGFAVVYDNDETNTIDMVRYDASGASVGSVVTINSAGTESQPEVLGLSDGRIAVTWQEVGTGQDIRMAIYDPRDAANAPVYTPDDYQIGTVGNDSFTADADFSFGYDGDDTITDGSGFNQIDAGDGNDTVIIVAVDAGETVDGGDGIDTLVGQTMSNGTVYDLAAQEVRFGGVTQSALRFENVTGTNVNEELIGNGFDNILLGGGGGDTISGGGGIDTIDGGDGDDTIDGGASGDTISGGNGNDTIDGSGGDDTIDGGGGNDTISGGSGIDLLTGGDGNDALFGGSTFNDTLLGGAGNDTLEAVGGGLIDGGADDDLFVVLNGNVIGDFDIGDADLFDGGSGNDTFDASNETTLAYTIDLGAETIDRGTVGVGTVQIVGFEHLIGSGQDDTLDAGGLNGITIEGGAGNDVITGGASFQALYGGDGDDTIDGGFAAGSFVSDLIDGGAGDDVITGASAGDTIDGGDGNDSIDGNSGNDTIDGGDGKDSLIGGSGADSLIGGRGGDMIDGGDGDDIIDAGGASDEVYGGTGNDVIDAGGGNDTVEASDGTDTLVLRGGADLAYGGADNDVINGMAGLDTLHGNAGDDAINGGGQNDLLYGGGGNDTVNGGNGNDIIAGGAGNDRLLGGFSADTILGSLGDDTLRGDDGNDVLEGGTGNDLLVGGGQADTFVFEDGFGQDTITDFDALERREDIDLSDVSAITNWADLSANHMTQVGSRVIIDDGLGNTIRLDGVNLADLDASDFLF